MPERNPLRGVANLSTRHYREVCKDHGYILRTCRCVALYSIKHEVRVPCREVCPEYED
jgi:hypothetical protein